MSVVQSPLEATKYTFMDSWIHSPGYSNVDVETDNNLI